MRGLADEGRGGGALPGRQQHRPAHPDRRAHGYKTVGTQPSLLINFPTEVYNARPGPLRGRPEHPFNQIQVGR
jgi:hypothetical protein